MGEVRKFMFETTLVMYNGEVITENTDYPIDLKNFREACRTFSAMIFEGTIKSFTMKRI